MKKEYTIPEIEIMAFENGDVIRTSTELPDHEF